MQLSQQAFLRDAMRRLDLTREALAERIGTSRRALDAWLLPEPSKEFRRMPEMARRFIGEIVARQRPQPAGPGLAAAAAVPGAPAHLLSVRQLDREAVAQLFALADLLVPVAQGQMRCPVLDGAVLANLFFEASTRTRVSFGAAFARLGGAVCDTTGFTFSSMAKGESLQDTARVISGYADAIVLRHPEQGSVAAFAGASRVPVINGGDGPGEHPSQALLDLYTIQNEFAPRGKRLDGAHVAVVGDLRYGRAVQSLLQLLALYRGMRFTLIAPPALALPPAMLELLGRQGHEIRSADAPGEALRDADVIYTTRLQQERYPPGLTEELNETLNSAASTPFLINRALLDRHAKPDVVLMHPLPRDSRPGAQDLATDLDGDARLAIFRQTDNGIPVRMALFAQLLGVAELVPQALQPLTRPWRRAGQA